MVAGLEPVVVFWTGWGIQFMVLLSFAVQVTLLLSADIRRRKDWVLLKLVIWSAYMLADTTAIYALGHMSVVCRLPEHHLMVLWAPLLLVHLGGQDNITAYAIEDNRLWLRHLQTFVLQVGAAGYVLYVSSILSQPSKVCFAAILMFVVGLLKYGERIWALKRADSCASSSLSARSCDKISVSRTAGESDLAITSWNEELIVAYSLLDVPKQMFEGPTSYVQISNELDNNKVPEAKDMFRVVEMQLSMMYDLLYTKAAMVHTWYGLSGRVLISLPFTVAALALFSSSATSHDIKDYKREDVTITYVLLTGAVVLETMSVLRAIFSKWTAVLLYGKGWNNIGDMVLGVEAVVTGVTEVLLGSETHRRMRQHSFIDLIMHRWQNSRCRKMAKGMGVEDWWDSNLYSWSTEIPTRALLEVLQVLKSRSEDITKSHGLNAVRRSMNNDEQLVTLIWTKDELKLDERILVWHIATHVYTRWCITTRSYFNTQARGQAALALADYMFFLLAARPYMLPYPISRQAYVQLCSDAVAHRLNSYSGYSIDWAEKFLLDAILKQEDALVKGTPFQPKTGAAAQSSVNTTLDRACQLAAKLIHITATPPKEKKNDSTTVKRSRKKQRQQREERVDGNNDIITGQTETETTFSVNGKVLNKFQYEVVLNMLFEVWAEMLCYTAYFCNEKYHAKQLTDGGGEIMTKITLMMIYMKNGGLFHRNASTSGTAAGPSSSQGATNIDSVV